MITTSDSLLTSIKRGISTPSSQGRFTDADILAMADEEISSRIVPLIKGLRQDYFLYSSTTSITSGQASYQIPFRAIGGAITDLRYSRDTAVENPVSLALIDASEAHDYSPAPNTGDPVAFYFKADKVVLVPTPTSGTLEFTYECAPSELVLVEGAGLVTAVTSTTVTVSALPSTITTGTAVDMVAAKGLSQVLAFEKSVTNVASTTLSFASGDIASDFTVGDYVCVAGQSCMLQIPKEARPLLALAVQARLLEALGDVELLQHIEQKIKQKTELLKGVLSPRVSDEPRVIMGALHPGRKSLRRGTWGMFR